MVTLYFQMNHRLPSDLWSLIYKDWIYPDVLSEVHKYHHTARFINVFNELLVDECVGYPGDPYFITNDGVFLMAGYCDHRHLYYVRLGLEDSVRYRAYRRDFSFEIQATDETQKLIDDVERKGLEHLEALEAFYRVPKHYTVSIVLNDTKTPVFTFKQYDTSVVGKIDDDFPLWRDAWFIRLPTDFNILY